MWGDNAGGLPWLRNWKWSPTDVVRAGRYLRFNYACDDAVPWVTYGSVADLLPPAAARATIRRLLNESLRASPSHYSC